MMIERQHKQALTCPTWHRPLLHVVSDGVEIRCVSCRHGVIHHIKRERLEQAWKELEQEEIERQGN